MHVLLLRVRTIYANASNPATSPICLSVSRSVCQSVGQLVGWLVGWMVGWLVGLLNVYKVSHIKDLILYSLTEYNFDSLSPPPFSFSFSLVLHLSCFQTR